MGCSTGASLDGLEEISFIHSPFIGHPSQVKLWSRMANALVIIIRQTPVFTELTF